MDFEQVIRLALLAQSLFLQLRSAINAARSGNPEDDAALIRLYRALNPTSVLSDAEILELFNADNFDGTMITLFEQNASAGVEDFAALIRRLQAMG